MEAEPAVTEKQYMGRKKNAKGGIDMRRMVTRQTTARSTLVTAPATENSTLAVVEGKRKRVAIPIGGNWRIDMSELNTSSNLSNTKKKSKQVVKPKASRKKTKPTKAIKKPVVTKPKKETSVVVAKKVKKTAALQVAKRVNKKEAATLIAAKKKSTKSKPKGVKVIVSVPKKIANKVIKKDKDKLVTRVKVAKLTTVALKKHEMRNDDLVTIRPPNRYVAM